MNFVKLQNLLSLFIAILLIATLACSPKSSSMGPGTAPAEPSVVSEGGTSDPGGGGDISFSTDEEVIAAIKRARAFLVSEKGRVYISTHLKRAIPAGESTSSQTLRAAVEKLSEGNLEAKLGRSSIEFKTNDTKEKNCASSGYSAYPDAYTKDLKFGAGICFNVHRLRRLTPESLYRNLISLWLHEITHLHGYGESVATSIGELSATAIVRLDTVSSLDTFDAISGMLRANLKTVAAMKAGHFGRTGALRVIRTQLNSVRGFRNFLINLDIAFALDDERPRVRPKVDVFLMDVESAERLVEAYYDGATGANTVPLARVSQELEHASLCVLKTFMGIANDMNYGSRMRVDNWNLAALGIGDWRKETCN